MFSIKEWFRNTNRRNRTASTPAEPETEENAGAVQEPAPPRRYSGRMRFHNFRKDFLAEREDAEREGAEAEEGDDSQVIPEEVIQQKLQAINSRVKYRSQDVSAKTYYDDSNETRPVFETHARFEARNAMYLHSFLGLRYSVPSSNPGRRSRRLRIAVGFGGNQSAMGRNRDQDQRGDNRLMNDADSHASASTQTVIDKRRALNLLDAIPKFSENFNYNVAGTNCNDFVRTMAKIVGASLPAELHTAVTGPLGAKQNILKAGAGDENTEVYYGNDFSSEGEPPYPKDLTKFAEWVKGEIKSAFDKDFRLPSYWRSRYYAVKIVSFEDVLDVLDQHIKFAFDLQKSAEERQTATLVAAQLCQYLKLQSKSLAVEGGSNLTSFAIKLPNWIHKLMIQLSQTVNR